MNNNLQSTIYHPYKLFVDEDFFDGVAYTVDLDENLVMYNTSSSIEEVNRKSIMSDVLNIAIDMGASVGILKEKNENNNLL